MPSKDQRLTILTASEIDEIYALPNFSDEDRNHYFTLSAAEHSALQKFKTEKTKALFILQLGYFKARNQFFDIDENRGQIFLQYY